MQLSVLVSADYVVQVKMVSYSHPSNTLPGGRCCDSPRGFNGVVPCNEGERCDTYFIYCLRPHASTATPCPSNEPGYTAVSNYIVDGADIDFTQPTVLGLSNPFNLTGILTAWEVRYCRLFQYTIACDYRELSFTYKCLIMMPIHQMILLQGID